MARILIMDDEPWYTTPLIDALSERRYSVHGVTSGAEGLAWLKQNRAALVVIDLLMSVKSVDDFVADLMAHAEAAVDQADALEGAHVVPGRQVGDIANQGTAIDGKSLAGGLDIYQTLRKLCPDQRVAVLSILSMAERAELAKQEGVDLADTLLLCKDQPFDDIVEAIDGAAKEAASE